ncbi:hypothetical protein HAX54_022486 [Datura stramonium]|uniref:Uncharacterized protein n=1 Tax=Datura stramonium TaxID=4076 RepID=A0ABS8UUL8_DATST|nr:hypothetical protein [Datura stramonium]
MNAQKVQAVNGKNEHPEFGIDKMRGELSRMGKLVDSHSTSIKQLERQMEKMLALLNQRHKNTSLGNILQSFGDEDQCKTVAMSNRKTTSENLIPVKDTSEKEPLQNQWRQLTAQREVNMAQSLYTEVHNTVQGLHFEVRNTVQNLHIEAHDAALELYPEICNMEGISRNNDKLLVS